MKESYQDNQKFIKKNSKTWAEDNPNKRKSIMDKWLKKTLYSVFFYCSLINFHL